MISRVTAVAHANIALVKYWGKQRGKQNAPATPSISLALDSLETKTRIERIKSKQDQFIINGKSSDKVSSDRLTAYLNIWRQKKLIDGSFRVKSQNNFPTKAGLASSSSGYAALAAGLNFFAHKQLNPAELSKLARIGSGSAARSIIGGLAALPNSPDPAARLILSPDKLPWGMVIAVVGEAAKEIGSGQGMKSSQLTSPYYRNWIKTAESDYRNMLTAIKNLDFTRIGEIMEANTLAMQACMIATRPSLIYWTGPTIDILKAVKEWRKKGLEAYATTDAGPQVAILARQADLRKISSKLKRIKSIKRVITGYPVGGARVIEWD